MPSIATPQTAILFAFMFTVAVAAITSVLLEAIRKKQRVKASGRFFKFGFEIEVEEDTKRDRK